ncbi:hypothetical protein AB0N06_35660 [Streptomyces sp. NPDC051020]|uniref:hypothetical protein n=1 Tax=Streptomyces sp. NPDC051020 TaxID=3155409 RepID=UPI00342C9C62
MPRVQSAQENRDQALRAAQDAETLVQRLTFQQGGDTWTGYPEQKHAVHLSRTFTQLGETTRATLVQDRALEPTHSPSLMTRALITIDRATCLAHNGEPEEAARIGAQAYTALPSAYRTGLTHTRALALARSLPHEMTGQFRDVLAMANASGGPHTAPDRATAARSSRSPRLSSSAPPNSC